MNKLRFGVLCRGLSFPRWQAQCLQAALATGIAEPALLIVEGSSVRKARVDRKLGQRDRQFACVANLTLCWLLAPVLGLLGVVLAWGSALLANAVLNLLANLWGLSRGGTEARVLESVPQGDAFPRTTGPQEPRLWWARS
jgi:hypothetical protein